MNEKQKSRKRIVGRLSNVLFFGLLLLFVFSTDAKSWLLRQMIATGLFKPKIEKSDTNVNVQPVTPFYFRNEQGNTVSTSELKGKVVFINFWASWCPPCRAEMPSLRILYNKLKDDNRFAFLFLNEDEDAAKAKAFLQKNDYPFPVMSAEGTVPADIFSGTLPTTVVLNKDGKMVMKHEDLAGYNNDDFIKQLRELL
jgi:thiol-disulfide isomerase/thioredoxin